MSGWMQAIDCGAMKERLRAIDAIDDESLDLVELITTSGVSAQVLVEGVLLSPVREQQKLRAAVVNDPRLCSQLQLEQKDWNRMEPQAKSEFVVSLHDDIRCIALESLNLHEWSSAKIKLVVDLLGVRCTQTAHRAAQLLIWLRQSRNDTFHRALKSRLTLAAKSPVGEAIIRDVVRRRDHAVARGFYYSPTRGFEGAPSGKEVTSWIANARELVFPLVDSPYRRILVAYVNVPEKKQYVEALWLTSGDADHYFVVSNELSEVEKYARVRHELRHFCDSAFVKIAREENRQ